MDVQTAAFVAGIIFGSLAVASASYVWVKHRAFGTGGIVLSLVGISLLGLSIWSSITIKVDQNGFSADFERLQSQVAEVTKTGLAVTDQVKKIAETTNTTREQFIALSKTLENRQAIRPETLEMIRKPVEQAPAPDPAVIDAASLKLRGLEAAISKH